MEVDERTLPRPVRMGVIRAQGLLLTDKDRETWGAISGREAILDIEEPAVPEDESLEVRCSSL